MTQFAIEAVAPKIRKVTFSNPPVNVVGADTVTQLLEVIDELTRDEQVQVVIFDSSTPGYFFNHADLGQVPELLALTGADGIPLFIELSVRLASAPFISIASIRGRTRGGGDEITLAFDLRYASREEAILCQPDVAIGIVPGGGGSDRLARLLGRSRAALISPGISPPSSSTPRRRSHATSMKLGQVLGGDCPCSSAPREKARI